VSRRPTTTPGLRTRPQHPPTAPALRPPPPSQAVRLAYLDRVQKELPAIFVPFLPPKPAGRLAWASGTSAGAVEPGSMGAKSAALLNRLRSKTEPADVKEWLHRAVEPAELPTLVMHSLLDAGSKSVSHLEKLLDKFGARLGRTANASFVPCEEWALRGSLGGEAGDRTCLCSGAVGPSRGRAGLVGLFARNEPRASRPLRRRSPTPEQHRT
jgi:hypothetical protein